MLYKNSNIPENYQGKKQGQHTDQVFISFKRGIEGDLVRLAENKWKVQTKGGLNFSLPFSHL
jgi:hypothetical protein